MLINGFPRWAIWLLNILIMIGLYLVAEVAKLAGWQVALGFLIGYVLCYVLYGCWRVDDKNEGYSRFPPEQRHARFERDRKIDPRLR